MKKQYKSERNRIHEKYLKINSNFVSVFILNNNKMHSLIYVEVFCSIFDFMTIRDVACSVCSIIKFAMQNEKNI